jgi:hypothetical protein
MFGGEQVVDNASHLTPSDRIEAERILQWHA